MNQRWRNHLDSYRPAGEPINTAQYEVGAIDSDTIARKFVETHHYSASYPAARFRFGLYRRCELVGTAIFSHPANDACLTNVFPGEVLAGVELGRLVLLDDVPANGETWFIARCFEMLKRSGIAGVLSCADPMPRTTLDGRTLFAGHVGTIYQAHNGIYIGRTRARMLRLLPDATVFNDRLIAKVRAAHRGDEVKARGWRSAISLLARFGAPQVEEFHSISDWLENCLSYFTRPLRHRGNHKYAWALSRSIRKYLPTGSAFPKQFDLAGGAS